MGAVWLARLRGKHGFERLVALKTVLPARGLEDRFRRMFLDEARLASQIQHPNIAQTFDLGETDGVLYFVMEWIDGDPIRKLRDALTQRKASFPLGIALRVCADACAAMHVAHELCGEDGELLNLVHRDISPYNILVSVTGVTKVIDFGIAKARERLAEETHADELKGRIDYMAPEQAVGPAIDRRADVWSLGAVLYYLLGGVPPFQADTKVASLMLRIEGKPPTPLGPEVPECVKAIVARALAREPSDRFGSAAEMHRAIEEAIAECRAVATSAEVAAFVKEHLGEGIEQRRASIRSALEAARERQRRSRVEAPVCVDVGRREKEMGQYADGPETEPTGTTRAAIELALSPSARAAEDVSGFHAPSPSAARRVGVKIGALVGAAAALVVVLVLAARAHLVGTRAQAAAPPVQGASSVSAPALKATAPQKRPAAATKSKAHVDGF
jgi:serine/threonine-protein kinase